ncbi:MAG: VOC family protein [Armatimonadetes bacterium]|nr:VOC family protein [Armatimonadota bacterium]
MVTGSSTTWCYVTDMDRAIRFYRDVLGLKPGVQSPYWSDFELGTGKIGLHPLGGAANGPTGVEGKGWYLGMAADDLVALRRAVEASDGQVVGDYHDTPAGVVLTFTDPDGNPVQAMQLGVKAADLRGR